MIMSRRTSPPREYPADEDDSVLEGQPRKFSKPSQRLKDANFYDNALTDSVTDASVISTRSPVKYFRAKKNRNPSQNFTKALETTGLDDSSIIETDGNSQRQFKRQQEVMKTDQTFSTAFETTSDTLFSVSLKGNNFVKSFKSRKETSKNSLTFSNALQTTTESFFDVDSTLDHTKTTFKPTNVRSKKSSAEKNCDFSNAFDSKNHLTVKHSKTFSHALQTTTESFVDVDSTLDHTKTTFRATNLRSKKSSTEKNCDSSNAFDSKNHLTVKHSKTFSHALQTTTESFVDVDSTLDHTKTTFRAPNLRSKKSSAEKNCDFSNAFDSKNHPTRKHGKTFLNVLETTDESSVEDDSLPVDQAVETTYRAAQFKSKKGSVEKNSDFSNESKCKREYSRDRLQCDLSKDMMDCAESPVRDYTDRCHLKNAKSKSKNRNFRVLDTNVGDADENEADLEDKYLTDIFSQSLSPILPAESAETCSKNQQNSCQNNVCDSNSSVESTNASIYDETFDLSVDLAPVLSEIESKIAPKNHSNEKISKIRKSDSTLNKTSKFDSETELKHSKSRNSSDCNSSDIIEFQVPKRPLRKKSSNIFSHHDLSLYLLSKGSRPKKRIPSQVVKQIKPESVQRPGKENKNSLRLKRPAYWATDKLYAFLQTTLERCDAENFIIKLANIVAESVNCSCEERKRKLINTLKYKMAKLKLVKSDIYFYDFIFEFLPFEFQDIAVPSIIPFSEKVSDPSFKLENLSKRYF